MSNTICIKHGANAPSNGVLQPFELGYVTSTGTLVIGDSNKNTKQLNYLPLNGGVLTDDLIAPNFSTDGTDSRATVTKNGSYLIEVNEKTISSWVRGIHVFNSSGDYMASLGFSGSEGTESSPSVIQRFYVGEKYSTDKHWLTLTPEGRLSIANLVVKQGISYGDTDPNIANSGKPISGIAGQLYFVVVG